MADRGTSLPDLDGFLVSARSTGQCRVCTSVPAEVRARIEERVAEGIKAWTAFHRYVEACGVQGITKPMLNHHFEAGHDGR